MRHAQRRAPPPDTRRARASGSAPCRRRSSRSPKKRTRPVRFSTVSTYGEKLLLAQALRDRHRRQRGSRCPRPPAPAPPRLPTARRIASISSASRRLSERVRGAAAAPFRCAARAAAARPARHRHRATARCEFLHEHARRDGFAVDQHAVAIADHRRSRSLPGLRRGSGSRVASLTSPRRTSGRAPVASATASRRSGSARPRAAKPPRAWPRTSLQDSNTTR